MLEAARLLQDDVEVQERTSLLSIQLVNATTVAEAAGEVRESNPGDETDIQYILNNPNSTEAEHLKSYGDTFHFFFGTLNRDGFVSILYWNAEDGQFERVQRHTARDWQSHWRAVLKN